MKTFEQLGVRIPKILLPKNLDTATWAVIACDQYTQDQSYWQRTEQAAGSKPSALHLILPEIYLNAPDCDARVESIRNAMRQYIRDGVFDSELTAFIYIERKTAFGRMRRGLMAEIDLERYDWNPQTKEAVRATEATIKERIPPRMKIRNGAPLETPHIMLLANDPEKLLTEGLGKRLASSAPRYSGNLMMNGGSIRGWVVENPDAAEYIRASLEKLAAQNTQPDGSVFLFAVGDGNHSLATAKAVWEERKAALKAAGADEAALQSDPVRYALVEIANLYDEGVTFEPIHRVIFHADAEKLIGLLAAELGGTAKNISDADALEAAVKESTASFGFIHTKDGKTVYTLLPTQLTELAVARLQPALDRFLEAHADASVDYIHGGAETIALGKKADAVGILLPPIAKNNLFTTINVRGPLPRKSFSIGEADEKRFYMECRSLFE